MITMGKAFKCDICGRLCEGEGTCLHITPRDGTHKITTNDICDECLNEMELRFANIGSRHRYENGFGYNK